MSDEITSIFQQRRQLALDIAKMAEAESEAELAAAAQTVAQAYPAGLILAEIVKNLNTLSSQLRGGLGHLAALLPETDVIPTLRSVAANRQNGAQERITAALLLERYVGDLVSASLLNDLDQSNEVAFQSLREAIDEGKNNRHILLEYAVQMRQAGGEIAYLVMDLLDRLAERDRVELLRLIALDDRIPVAAAALERLERLAQGEAGQEALAALHTLAFVLPPVLAPSAERSLRKLRFSGLRYQPPQPEGWRCLISPADMGGFQSIWFARMPTTLEDPQADGAILGVIANGRVGLAYAFGRERITAEEMPAPRTLGEIARVNLDGGRSTLMLEVPFDYGRWRIQQALAAHWQAATELPDEFRLYCDLIARFDAPEIEPALRACHEEQIEAQTEGQTEALPGHALQTAAAALLADPAMTAWLRPHGLLVIGLNEQESRISANARAGLVQSILSELEQHPERDVLRLAMIEGLRSQAAWLMLAGRQEQSDRALLLARHLHNAPPSRNPLLAQIIEAGLQAQAASDDRA